MNKIFQNKKILLASQSPRRHSLIKKLIVDFDTINPSCEEKLKSNIYTDEKIESLSLQKALSVLNNNTNDKNPLENCLIINADTVVVLDNVILGKPKDEKNAYEMLSALS